MAMDNNKKEFIHPSRQRFPDLINIQMLRFHLLELTKSKRSLDPFKYIVTQANGFSGVPGLAMIHVCYIHAYLY